MTGLLSTPSRRAHESSESGPVVGGRTRSSAARVARWLTISVCLTAAAGAIGLCTFLLVVGRTPREWAPYILRRAQEHNPVIVTAAGLAASWLVQADRPAMGEAPPLPPSLGASPARSGNVPAGRLRTVASLEELSDTVRTAQAGDVIEIQPGHYRAKMWSPISFRAGGTAAAPITVRARRLGDVVIESDMVETFKVFAPFWRFENLSMRGVCTPAANCEHAIHIVGAASGVVLRNNQFEDYNAQIKINGEDGRWPDHGVIDSNSLIDTTPRDTLNPVTPIDLVGASHWRISRNVIADFVRSNGGSPTYGAFVKGAGTGNIFERNLVVCEWRLTHAGGQHIGLSLGGGGTDPGLRRDAGRSGLEQIGGVIRDNLIARCSDDGIYLNRSAGSIIDHNTLLDTAGIDARFVETSAQVASNIVDGVVRSRDGGTLLVRNNIAPFLLGLFVGLHPQRGLYRDPAHLDLRWQHEPERRRDHDPRLDLCGHQRGTASLPGAFEDYADCFRP